MNDRELGRRLRRPSHQVRCQRIALGIPPFKARPKSPIWTAREMALVGTMPDAELAMRIRRSLMAVQVRRGLLGIPKPDPVHKKWRPAEDRLLGTTRDDQLARALGCHPKAVSYRRRKLGIPRFFAPFWTADQDGLLGIQADERVARRLHRSARAVEARRLKLGISLSPNVRLRRPPHRWTTRQLRWLGKFSDEEVAQRIGCVPAMVTKKRLKLHIPKQRDSSSSQS
jgi:hypothetical protein